MADAGGAMGALDVAEWLLAILHAVNEIAVNVAVSFVFGNGTGGDWLAVANGVHVAFTGRVIHEQAIGEPVSEPFMVLAIGRDDFDRPFFHFVDGEHSAAEFMRSPIGHAAAGIIPPGTPTRAVDVEGAADAIRMVRRPRGRPEPHIPIQPRRDGFAWQEIGRASCRERV